jgi:Rrf2 family protein
MLTKKTLYAVIAMMELAKAGQTPLKLKTLVETQSLPKAFMDHIFSILKKARLVRVQKGPGGGYILFKTAATTTLWEIIHAIGDLDSFNEPLSETAEAKALHKVLTELNANIEGFFEISLEDLVKGLR